MTNQAEQKNEVALVGQSITNPYQSTSIVKKNETEGGVAVEAQKATIEVMTSFEVAKRFPRDPMIASNKIIAECSRPTLAELAVYSYSKGGTAIEGPTIRLMEAIARSWGNIRFGWQCLESNAQRSVIRAFAFDLEANILRETTFEVKHWRDTKQGGYALKDEREIYELQANKAMRRVRGCLEGLIPRDVIDMALSACEQTSKNSVDTTPEGIAKLLTFFEGFGVNRAMIEARNQGLKMESMKAPQVVGLRKIAAALRDGVAKVEDFFDVGLADKKEAEKTGQPDLKKDVAQKKEAEAAQENSGDKKPEKASESDDMFPGDKPSKK
jgi:hypothetical protein